MRVAVFGSSGFVGSEIARVLSESGIEVLAVPAPRLRASSRTEEGLQAELPEASAVEQTNRLSDVLQGLDAVINSAGMAEPSSGESDELFGANALLPGIISRAAGKAGVSLVLHISSAAVYGSSRQLDPSAQPIPESPYGRSKLLGEIVAKAAAEGTRVLIYRPTSVHGAGRAVTEKIAKLARSRFSSVAAPGTDPTPQVMVEQVAEYVRGMVMNPPSTDDPIIHPWEGWTTSSFLEHMGNGRSPIMVPRSLARVALGAAKGLGRLHPRIGANVRRLEMLWFGQGQLGDGTTSPRTSAQATRKIVIATTIDYQLRYHRELAIELAHRGWEVHIVSSQGPILEQLGTVSGVTTHVLTMRRDPHPLHDFTALRQWRALLKEVSPNVLFVGTPKASLLGLLAGKLRRVPSRVYFVHGLRFQGATGMKRKILLALEKTTVLLATDVVAVSGSVRREMIQQRVARPIHVQVIGAGSANGVDLERFAVRSSLQESGPLRLGVIGRVNRDKGLDILAEAIRLLPADLKDFELRVVGSVEGDDGHALLADIKLAHQNTIHEEHREDIETVYSGIDILCIPSRREGMSTVVLEAMAAGVIVVGTPATGITDLVRDRKTGYLSEDFSGKSYVVALEAALRSVEDRSVQAAARALLEAYFDKDIVIPQQAAALKKVIER